MIDVDEVEAGCFLTEFHLPGPGLADIDFFPSEDVRPSGPMNLDRVRHHAQMGFLRPK